MQSFAERTAGGTMSTSKAPTITFEIFFGDEAVEIAVEAPQDLAPSDKRRFSLLNVSGQLFNNALGEAARRKGSAKWLRDTTSGDREWWGPPFSPTRR